VDLLTDEPRDTNRESPGAGARQVTRDLSQRPVFDSHWYLDKREYTEQVSGKKFKRLVVDDVDGCRLAKLKTMTAVEHNGTVYKFRSKDSFISAVPSYEFKIYPVGLR
jgi:hypothetical protein